MNARGSGGGLDALAALSVPGDRALQAAALAGVVGARDLLVFVPDAEVGVLTPAPGFRATLPGGSGWHDLLHRCRTAGEHEGEVRYPDAQTSARARAIALPGGAVFVFVGGAPDFGVLDPAGLALAGALFHAESRAQAAQARAAAAQELARHAQALMAAVDQARAQAEDAISAKDQFLAMLGHELRNPLSPIVTALQLAKLRGGVSLPPEFQIVERQVEHLVTLVDDLLDVARITRGKVDLRLQEVEVAQLVRAAVEVASPLLERHRLCLQLELPAESLQVRADPTRLGQVLSNLLTNAAKYTPPPGTITLAAARVGNDAVIRVRDSGVGISADLLPRIFDLFVQGPQTARRPEGGLGIGLAVVRNLVRLHGGTVTATSGGAGQGAEFTVRLPALPAQPLAAAPAPNDTASWLTQPAPTRKGRSILVVDDNSDAATLLADVLRAVGHDVQVACDGPSALTVSLEHPPDIAILDLSMPVMDGYELARRLRERPRPPRLIALSGYGQLHDRVRSQALGFERHLVKPIDVGVVLEAIQHPKVNAGVSP